MDPLSGFALPSDLVVVLARIDEFKGEWRGALPLPQRRLAEMRRVATVQSVASSTRIEGVVLSDSAVDQLLRGGSSVEFESRDEQEVAGYAAAVDLVLESHREITLIEPHIHQLHQVMLQYSSADERHRGRYKTMPNSIQAFDAEGRSLGVVSETATPFETPVRMTDLIRWTAEELEADRHHPLVVIATFVVRFLAVHPYQDGNGRLSRILTTLLLLRSGYGYVAYSSLERIVEARKPDYYRALNSAQRTLDRGEAGRESWVRFFLGTLDGQVHELRRTLALERMPAELPPLAASLLAIVQQQGRVTPRAAQRSTGASINTIKAHLRQLVEQGHLQRLGVGRGTWYEIGRH